MQPALFSKSYQRYYLSSTYLQSAAANTGDDASLTATTTPFPPVRCPSNPPPQYPKHRSRHTTQHQKILSIIQPKPRHSPKPTPPTCHCTSVSATRPPATKGVKHEQKSLRGNTSEAQNAETALVEITVETPGMHVSLDEDVCGDGVELARPKLGPPAPRTNENTSQKHECVKGF